MLSKVYLRAYEKNGACYDDALLGFDFPFRTWGPWRLRAVSEGRIPLFTLSSTSSAAHRFAHLGTRALPYFVAKVTHAHVQKQMRYLRFPQIQGPTDTNF